MKILNTLSVSSLLLFIGCAQDKNMEDYRREQLQQNLFRIASVSGAYTGSVVSKIDGTNLGVITLKFQARTNVHESTNDVSNQQNATVSGSLNFQSLTSAEVVFDNGFYDDLSGAFQVTIPSARLSLTGIVHGDSWIGTIEANGQPEFGAHLSLQKNAPLPNSSSIEVGGSRLQQIKKMDYAYVGAYIHDGVSIPFKMNFLNKDILPEQNLFKLFSPVRNVNVHCDFSGFELNFSNAIIDDKTGKLVGNNAYDQQNAPVQANLNCIKYELQNGDFGWDCDIQTNVTKLKLHLTAKR